MNYSGYVGHVLFLLPGWPSHKSKKASSHVLESWWNLGRHTLCLAAAGGHTSLGAPNLPETYHRQLVIKPMNNMQNTNLVSWLHAQWPLLKQIEPLLICVLAVCQDVQLRDWLEEHQQCTICCFCCSFPGDTPHSLPHKVRKTVGCCRSETSPCTSSNVSSVVLHPESSTPPRCSPWRRLNLLQATTSLMPC